MTYLTNCWSVVKENPFEWQSRNPINWSKLLRSLIEVKYWGMHGETMHTITIMWKLYWFSTFSLNSEIKHRSFVIMAKQNLNVISLDNVKVKKPLTLEQHRFELHGWVHWHMDFFFFFPVNIQSVVTPGFISEIQPWGIKISIFDPWLGIHRCGGQTRAFWYLWGSWNQSLWILRDALSFWGVKIYTWTFQCMEGVSILNFHIVQESTV